MVQKTEASSSGISKNSQDYESLETKSRLVVCLDNNFGLPAGVSVKSKQPSSANNITKSPSNSGKNKQTPQKRHPLIRMPVVTRVLPPVNGAGTSQLVHFSKQNISYVRLPASTPVSINNSNVSNVDDPLEKRCRSCLKVRCAKYRSISEPCYSKKTIKDAILKLVPEMNFPFEDTDVVCENCFQILKGCLEFTVKFLNAEKILHAECRKPDSTDHEYPNIPSSFISRYTPFKDNIELGGAEKIVALSKIDNNNLTNFIETLHSNHVKIFQHEQNPYSRKRVLLLGNSKLRRCNVCYAKFLSETQLQEHLNKEHKITKEYLVKPIRHVTGAENEPLTCRACNKTFLTDFNLKSHLKWCISFPCPHCQDQKTYSCENLVQHTRSIHQDNSPFKCCKCKKAFSEYKLFVKHSCSGHVCDKCGNKFPTLASLTYHLDLHKDVPCNKPYKFCPACKKILTSEDYPSHLSNHKKLICSKCEMIFYKKEALQEHEKTHKKAINMHKCEICDRLFIKEYSLQKHMEIHKQSEEVTCEICNETLDNMDSLKEHIMKSHGDPIPEVMCDVCGEAMKPEKLEQHVRLKHSQKKKLKCPLCSEMFEKSFHLEKHMDQHANGSIRSKNIEENVDNAQGVFDDDNNMDLFDSQEEQDFVYNTMDAEAMETVEYEEEENIDHIRSELEFQSNDGGTPNKRRKLEQIVSNGSFTCEYCSKKFSDSESLSNHRKIHINPLGPVKCTQCNTLFKSRAALKKHEEAVHEKTPKFRCSICWRIMQSQEELKNHVKTHTKRC